MNRRQFVIGGLAASLVPAIVSAGPREQAELQWRAEIKG
jgi:hypothetical protein